MVKKLSKIVLIVLLFLGCDSATDSVDLVSLEGIVFEYDAENNALPVEGALITAQGLYKQTLSDIDGNYSFEAEPAADSSAITIRASKIGYFESSTFIYVARGQSLQVPSLEMKKVTLVDTSDSGGDDPTTSGEAAHIEFISPHESHIYVYSSGLQETAVLGVKVTDAQGNLVDQEHAVEVKFNILQGPDGGEYLDPGSMTTENGFAFTVLNSGTIAGPIQIEAYVDLPTKTIHAIPSRIAIYGGLPDDDHFSVAVEKVNIAGQVHFGILDVVTAFVGDKYSNPVAPGTIVYFSTEYGIVEGAAVTDELGRASVNFLSAAPLPLNPATDSFTEITAWTYGDTISGLTLSTSFELLLSSVTDNIDVSPSSFQYNDLNEAKSFSFNVSDIYEYPIVENSVISVQATDGELFGDTQFKTLDSRSSGNGTTDFGFVWAPGDSLKAPQVFITITVTSPEEGNGSRSTNISGVKTP